VRPEKKEKKNKKIDRKRGWENPEADVQTKFGEAGGDTEGGTNKKKEKKRM